MPVIVITDNTTGGTHAGSDDVFISESTPTANKDTDNTEVHAYTSGSRSNTLLRFTLPAVLTGATINSATLSLYVADKTLSYQVDVHRCLRAWVEGSATWNTYDGTNNWATGGATGSGDMNASATAGVTVSASVNFYQDFDGLAADVQAWADGTPNNGWLLKRNNYTAYDFHYVVFRRSEGTDGGRPILTVDYTPGGGGGGSTLLRKLNHFLRA